MMSAARRLLWLLCLLPLSVAADERILDYRSDIQIQPGGELLVTETIRVRAEGRDIRRGIYRDFPTRYRDRWGNHVTADFEPLAVRRNGAAEPWRSERRSNGVRVWFGSANRLLEAGVHEYEFVFATNRQLGFFDDHDELYFNAIGTGWMFPIEHGSATVRLPFDVAAEQLQTAAYTGRSGATGAAAAVSLPAADTVRFETTAPLAPRHGLTIAVGWPKGLIEEPGAVQKVRWFLGDNAAAIVLLAGWLAALAWYLWAWNRVGRDPEKGVIIPRFEPPQGLSPAGCRYVRDMAFGSDAFTAAIISLAVKGRLQIEEADDEFSLQRTSDPGTAPLTPGEQAVLDTLLPGRGDRITLDNENYQDFQAARAALKQALKKEHLGRLFHLNSVYLAPPVLISAAAALLAVFFRGSPPVWIAYAVLTLALHGLFLFLLRAPTPAGRRVMDEIEGFRR